jgi:hypothetical protein
VHERYLFGQEFVYPKFDDCVGLAATDLHDRPGLCHDLGDPARVALGELGIAIFVNESHLTLETGWSG